jgi:hypothetical protein
MMECPDTFGGIPVVILAGDDYQLASQFQGAIKSISRNDGGKMTEKGRQCFRGCAQTVFELSTSRRVSDRKKRDKEIMEAVREGTNITDEQFEKLSSLHLENIKRKHGPRTVKDIMDKAVYIFWTNDKRIQHNLTSLVRLNTPDNPTAVLKTKSVCSKHAKGVNSHFKNQEFPGTSMMCVGAKVAIQGRNFQPMWGLHNGACGIVQEIIFSAGHSPNNGDLPKYVVCDFPLYCGPVWDPDHPTVRMLFCHFVRCLSILKPGFLTNAFS